MARNLVKSAVRANRGAKREQKRDADVAFVEAQSEAEKERMALLREKLQKAQLSLADHILEIPPAQLAEIIAKPRGLEAILRRYGAMGAVGLSHLMLSEDERIKAMASKALLDAAMQVGDEQDAQELRLIDEDDKRLLARYAKDAMANASAMAAEARREAEQVQELECEQEQEQERE